MSAPSEVDIMLKKAVRLLHSSHINSATELRMMLDDVIKQRYGPEKMLINTLSKRQLEEELNFPGRAVTPPPQPMQQDEPEEIINLTHSPPKTISDSPDTIVDSDDAVSIGILGTGGSAGSTLLTGGEDDGNLKEFVDLNCCVCGEIIFTATNRLIECSKCGTLYHQECHTPAITNEEASEENVHTWQCNSCCNKPSTSKEAGITVIPDEPISLIAKTKSVTSSHSSCSSNSSSPYYKPEHVSSSSTKHHKSSSSKLHREDRPSSSNSNQRIVTPCINVISASERSSHSSSKKSHSSKYSSSKSSKHYESSKRKK